MAVVVVVVVMALAVADEDHLGHGHMYARDLLRLWRDQGVSWTISRVDCGCYTDDFADREDLTNENTTMDEDSGAGFDADCSSLGLRQIWLRRQRRGGKG